MSKILSIIKKEPYNLDEGMSIYELFSVLLDRGFQILRGVATKPMLKKSKGLIFRGKNVKIISPRKISCGSNFILEDNCFINAISRLGIVAGDNVSIGRNSIIECTGVIREVGEGIIIGNNVGIAANAFIAARGIIDIGQDTIIGPGVSLHAENHNFSNLDVPVRRQGATRKGIIIGPDCWIGAKAIILDGVRIGRGVVVGAGSVINKNIPEFSVVAGVPAKIIKSRK